jgi:hypothetical protein
VFNKILPTARDIVSKRGYDCDCFTILKYRRATVMLLRQTTHRNSGLLICVKGTYGVGGHAAGGVVGWGSALLTGRSRDHFPMVVLDFSLT